MFRSIYAKLLTVFLAVMLLAMALLSVLLYQRIRNDKMASRLSELTVQARDLAYLAAKIGPYSTPEVDEYYLWKANEIRKEYDASLLVLDVNMEVIPFVEEIVEYSDELTLADLQTLLLRVYSGQEVRVPLVQKDTGNAVYVVGVPYVKDNRVLSAVFIHTSEQNVVASYRDILLEAFRSMMIVLGLGSLLILFVCQYIARPLREMARAADRFARGDFEQRVVTRSRDEVGRLAASFNSMAADLDQLEQTRREFVANVSHELRSPLTSIQGFVSGMLDGTIPESEREHYLSIVLDETKRLSKLISTLLDLSHIQSGQTPLSKSQFDINELVSRVLIRQEARISERDIDIEILFESDVQKVSGDADRIEQVLINLIDNAVKYVGGGGHITLKTRREHGKVWVSVEDDGPGISPEQIGRVFDRFYMVEKAHTKGTGTGLGLAIVKSIVEQHGQQVRAMSVTPHGVRFEFSLDAV